MELYTLEAECVKFNIINIDCFDIDATFNICIDGKYLAKLVVDPGDLNAPVLIYKKKWENGIRGYLSEHTIQQISKITNRIFLYL